MLEKWKVTTALAISISLASTPSFAKDPVLKAEPGFTCGAILCGLQQLLPIKAEQEASTLQTLNQLSVTNSYFIKKPTTKPSIKQYLISGDYERLSDSDRSKIAGQINGIVADAVVKESADRLLRAGVTLRGRDSAEKFFSELEGTVRTYQELVAKDDLNPEKSWNKGLLKFIRVITPLDLWALLSTFPKSPGGYVSKVWGAYWAWQLLSMATIPMAQRTAELGQLLNAAKSFLDTSSDQKRVVAFSHQYRILPETFQESTDGGIIQTQTLVKETSGKHRPLVPAPPSISGMISGSFKLNKPQTSYAIIDIVLESTGPNPEDTYLSVYARVTKSKPKPKKPNIPAPERETKTQLVPSLIPVPVPTSI